MSNKYINDAIKQARSINDPAFTAGRLFIQRDSFGTNLKSAGSWNAKAQRCGQDAGHE
jgi:hypothetical protein